VSTTSRGDLTSTDAAERPEPRTVVPEQVDRARSGALPAPPEEAPAEPEPPPLRALSRPGLAIAALVAIALVLILSVAPMAHLAGVRPLAPGALYTVVTRAAAGTSSATDEAAVRRLPEGLPAAATVRTADDVRPYAVAALGALAADRLMNAIGGSEDLSTEASDGAGNTPYPYRYPTLDPILDSAPAEDFRFGATALGAALVLLAGQPPFPNGTTGTAAGMPILNAAPAAFAVLERARASGACAPQLDLLLLLVADEVTSDSRSDVLSTERQRAESACPGDPTAGWLIGQGQLRHNPVAESASGSGVPAATTPPGVVTMQGVVTRFPRSVLAHTGLGDAYLGTAVWLGGRQPFTSRAFFQQALAEYNAAAELGGAREAAPGQARALIGLGDPARAAALLAPLLDNSAAPGGLLEIAIAAEESAHRFGDAERLARRLDHLGPSSYPVGRGMLPDPGLLVRDDTLQDTSVPLSLGTETLSTLRATVVAAGGAGGSAEDLSFIPRYRESPGLTGTVAKCAGWAWRRDAVLAGHPGDALDWPGTLSSARPSAEWCWDGSGPAGLRAVASLAAGRPLAVDDADRDSIVDEQQNLLRWAGDLTGARRVAETWQAGRSDATAKPLLRLGEIEFLQGRFDEAAVRFRLAARTARLVDGTDDLAVAQAELDQAAARRAAGRGAEAETTLRLLDQLGARGFGYQKSSGGFYAGDFAAISYHASAQLGDLERESGRLQAAVEDYEGALAWEPVIGGYLTATGRTDVLANNAALANLALGRTARAAELARRALEGDPRNPVFLMTAGFIADRRGELRSAVQRDRQALENDPGAFPAANDLGVELARLGQRAAAERAFRAAVGARPDYALGWFNLGVLESGRGPGRLLAAQDAFARAYALDPALRVGRPVLTIDGAVYRTGLDLSKPLPPSWSLRQLNRPAPAVSLGLLALVSAGLGLARATTRQGSALAERWLEPLTRRLDSVPLLRRLRHPAWALGATVVTFLVADLRSTPGITELITYALGVLAIAAVAMYVRRAVARRRHTSATQLSWGPGILFGVTMGAFGFPWAPLPVVTTRNDEAAVHLAAPVALGGVALLLFVESAWLHTPLSHAWAVAALIMAASALLPVGPLDGAHVGKAGVAASAGLIGTALLVGLGLI
jgi:cellulose synthase operon protein C